MTKSQGTKYSVRGSQEDSELFEKMAKREGFSTVPQWMLSVCRRYVNGTLESPLMALEKLIQELAPEDLDKIAQAFSGKVDRHRPTHRDS